MTNCRGHVRVGNSIGLNSLLLAWSVIVKEGGVSCESLSSDDEVLAIIQEGYANKLTHCCSILHLVADSSSIAIIIFFFPSSSPTSWRGIMFSLVTMWEQRCVNEWGKGNMSSDRENYLHSFMFAWLGVVREKVRVDRVRKKEGSSFWISWEELDDIFPQILGAQQSSYFSIIQ